MGPENIEFVSAEFREVLQGVEKHRDVLVVEFGFVSVCNGDFDKIRVLLLAPSRTKSGESEEYLSVVGFVEMFIVRGFRTTFLHIISPLRFRSFRL